MAFVYKSADNTKTYWSAVPNDPNVPAGYVLTSGSDGASDSALQTYVGGQWSGGFPAYNGYSDGSATNGSL